MNIHREMAKYRLIFIRAHEQWTRLSEVQHENENQSNGAGPSWEAEAEEAILCAIVSVEQTLRKDICDSFDFGKDRHNSDVDRMNATINKWRVIMDEGTSDNMVFHRETIRAILNDLAAPMKEGES